MAVAADAAGGPRRHGALLGRVVAAGHRASVGVAAGVGLVQLVQVERCVAADPGACGDARLLQAEYRRVPRCRAAPLSAEQQRCDMRRTYRCGPQSVTSASMAALALWQSAQVVLPSVSRPWCWLYRPSMPEGLTGLWHVVHVAE